MIYVIVEVSYDYHRFQDNLAATTDLEKARVIARERAKSDHHDRVLEDVRASEALDEKETRHILIETYQDA